MVKESYIASRQIVENGGSLELYLLAQRLNKNYCESIYHTHYGGQNDLSLYGMRHKNTPYQFGVYPIFKPAVMLLFGPECQNYDILTRFAELNPTEKHIFLVSHSLVDVSEPDIYAELDSIDNIFVGVKRIEAKIGPINKLKTIQRQTDLTWEQMHDYIQQDPLLLFRKPETDIELRIKVYMKLYQNSAAEALRSTAASIFYGRVSASVSANAFVIPFQNEERKTYKECFEYLMTSKPDDIKRIHSLYPQQDEFKVINKLKDLIFDYDKRSFVETQNLRTLQLSKLYQRIKNPIMELLKHFWVDRINVSYETPTSYLRDWINLRTSIPILRDSLSETLDQFSGERDKKIRSLILILLRLMSFNPKPMKAIVFGPSSRSYDNTFLQLTQQNYFHSSTSKETKTPLLENNITRISDKLSFAYDYFALGIKYNLFIDVNHLIDMNDVDMFCLDQFTSHQSKKKILIMLLYLGYLSDIKEWSKRTHTIFHQWVRRQKYDETKKYWAGPYELKVQYGNVIAIIKGDEQQANLIFNNTNDSIITLEILMKFCELLNYSLDQLLNMLPKGYYIKLTDRVIISHEKVGFNIDYDKMSNILINPGDLLIEDDMLALYDNYDNLIMRTPVGLMPTEYIPSKDELKTEINMNGILFSELIKVKPFSIHFSLQNIDSRTLVNLLQNLDVPKPKISKITKIRLNLMDWEERDSTEEFKKFEEEELIDSKEEKEAKISKFMDELAEFNPDSKNIESLLDTSKLNFHDLWIDPNINLDFMLTLRKKDITYQPQRIWDRIINLKYMIISSLCVDINILNRKTIGIISRATNSINIKYSLIFSYDKTFTNTETPSPAGAQMNINEYFDLKFLQIQDTL